MMRSLSTFLSAAILVAGIAMGPSTSPAQEHKASVTYHDKRHNDDHEWNDREDRAYGIWQKNTHRKEVEFSARKPSEQQTYWNWRHTHSDASLKIDIR